MAEQRHIYGEIENKTNLHDVFLQIRHDVDDAHSRADLTELYRRAGYLVTLSFSPSWQEKFGQELGELRGVAKKSSLGPRERSTTRLTKSARIPTTTKPGEAKMADKANRYTPTEQRWKGGAEEKYVTYDVEQATRGSKSALYPKVKRVYVPGKVTDWQVGRFKKKSGRSVHGVRVDYEQSRKGYERKSYSAQRGETNYKVPQSGVKKTRQSFTKIVEVPARAENIKFRSSLPKKYESAMQSVR